MSNSAGVIARTHYCTNGCHFIWCWWHLCPKPSGCFVQVIRPIGSCIESSWRWINRCRWHLCPKPSEYFVQVIRITRNYTDASLLRVGLSSATMFFFPWLSLQFCLVPISCILRPSDYPAVPIFMLKLSNSILLWVLFSFFVLLGLTLHPWDLRSFTWQTRLVILTMLSLNHQITIIA